MNEIPEISKIIKRTLIFFILLFIFYDFFPIFKSPDFRYTGSNPESLVWNFGAPYTFFIFDKNISPFIYISPIFYFGIMLQIAFILILKPMLKLYFYQIIPWLMDNIFFKKLSSQLTEIELTENGFILKKLFGVKPKIFSWSNIKTVRFSKNYEEVVIKTSNKDIILKKDKIGWYELIQNIPIKYSSFDFHFVKKLIDSLKPCGVCGIVAVDENQCVVCETIAWNAGMSENKTEYIKSKQLEFYSTNEKERFKIKKEAEPEHDFKADKNWKLYI